jgi:hypothetical protein
MSCKKQNDLLTQVFNQTDLQTIDKIIEYYDAFVISQTSNLLSVDKAYIEFFEKNNSILKQADGIYKLRPKQDQLLDFYKTLDKNVLSEFYNIKDTLTIHFRGENNFRKVYSPFSFDLNLTGKYFDLLKELSSRNDFFKKYFENIQNAGDISPVNYAMILLDYNKIDFSKKDERLVVIINLLHARAPVQAN